MARVRLYFRGEKDYSFPKDFDDQLSYGFVNIISDCIKSDDEFSDFEFFTFSDFTLGQFSEYGAFLISLDGIVHVDVSSVSEFFLRRLISYITLRNNFHYNDNYLSFFKFEFFEEVDFSSCESSFICVSPICLLNFSGRGLFSALENILKNNYCTFHGLKKCDFYCEITTQGDIFQKYVEKSNSKFNNYFYFLDLLLVGDEELISFAYDGGLGNNTNNGFGMLDLY